jgi:hypothetical protein
MSSQRPFPPGKTSTGKVCPAGFGAWLLWQCQPTCGTLNPPGILDIGLFKFLDLSPYRLLNGILFSVCPGFFQSPRVRPLERSSKLFLPQFHGSSPKLHDRPGGFHNLSDRPVLEPGGMMSKHCFTSRVVSSSPWTTLQCLRLWLLEIQRQEILLP